MTAKILAVKTTLSTLIKYTLIATAIVSVFLLGAAYAVFCDTYTIMLVRN